jgi:hypothetical protein
MQVALADRFPDCTGVDLDLAPASVSLPTTGSYENRGAFVTALKDIEVCALGVDANIAGSQMFTCNVFEANGTERGALLASVSKVAVPWAMWQEVPIDIPLEACRDYNITFEWGAVSQWRYFDTSADPLPWDVAGLIRVRAGEKDGSPDSKVPRIFFYGTPAIPEVVLDPTPPDVPWSLIPPDTPASYNIDFIPLRTVNLSGISLEGAYPALPGTLWASLRDMDVSKDISYGRAYPDAPGLQDHLAPLSGVLYEGRRYLIYGDHPAIPTYAT